MIIVFLGISPIIRELRIREITSLSRLYEYKFNRLFF